jgi:hypothetical protein
MFADTARREFNSFQLILTTTLQAAGSVVYWGIIPQAGWLRVRIPIISLYIFNLPNPSQPPCGPGVDSASNRNEWRGSSLGVRGGRRVSLTSSSIYVSRLSRKCGTLDFPQTHGPPLTVTGIALPFYRYLTEGLKTVCDVLSCQRDFH